MKLKRFLALSLAIGCGASTLAITTRAATTQQPRRSSRSRAAGNKNRATKNSSAQAQASEKKVVSNIAATAEPVAVREIDIAALKKILQRGNTQPPSSSTSTSSSSSARPLLVNFWATWCEPCREEFPDLVRINEDYKKRGLDFIVVSLDDIEELNKGVPQFLRRMHATMPAYLLNAPDQEAAMNAVDEQWGGALPATFLFGDKGQIIFRHMGRIKPAELRAAIEKSGIQKMDVKKASPK
ncbi:MAG: TlpA family protein disulfide reductase [Pyrinomonadaceae bacterium]